jgi:hypothetical protein
MAQSRRTAKKILLNLALAGVGVVAALLLLELGARFLPPPFENTSNQAETCWTETGWRGAANFKTTVATEGYVHDLALNSLGMHDTEHPLPKPDNTFRILLLGDSFVHAVHVKEAETAHQVLEDALNAARPTQNIEVISAGVSGWGTGQQLLYYRAEGRHYRPDLVLLMFYLGNDVKDNLPGRGITVEGTNCYAPYFSLAGNQLDPTPWQFAPGVLPAIGSASTLKKIANNLLAGLYAHSRLYAQIEPLLSPPEVKASMLDFYIGDNETFDYALDLTGALVNQLGQEVQADGADFGVVLVSPLSLVEFSQMDAAAREEVYQNIPAMRRAEEISPPNETLAAQFSAAGFPTLDLLPPFLEFTAATGTLPYFKADQHWNVAGNKLAGETIALWLAREQQLP